MTTRRPEPGEGSQPGPRGGTRRPERADAREVLALRRFRQAVDADWQRCRELGVTGVPTFVIGDQGLLGAQPYEVLAHFVAAMANPR